LINVSYQLSLVPAAFRRAGADPNALKESSPGNSHNPVLSFVWEEVGELVIYPLTQPSQKALKKIKDSVTAMTHRRMTPKPLNVAIEDLNKPFAAGLDTSIPGTAARRSTVSSSM